MNFWERIVLKKPWQTAGARKTVAVPVDVSAGTFLVYITAM